MKRTLAIMMMTVYGILSIGIHLHLHYCCGKISEIQLFESKDCDHHEHGPCEMHKNCCSFDDLSFKIEDTHQSSSFKLTLPAPVETPAVVAVADSFQEEKYAVAFTAEDSPPLGSVPIYLLNHSLVLYA